MTQENKFKFIELIPLKKATTFSKCCKDELNFKLNDVIDYINEQTKLLERWLSIFYGRVNETIDTITTLEGIVLNLPQEQRERLLTPIKSTELSVRVKVSCCAVNINTVYDLVLKTEDDLLKIRGFGKVSLKEVIEFLSKFNLTLRGGRQ